MMVRINLLPNARKQARSGAGGGDGSATPWIIAYLAAAFVTMLVCALLYFNGTSALEEQRAQNAALQTQITGLESQSANIDEVRAQLAQSQDLEQVVGDLQRARFGPTRVLMEMSHILSASGGPTVDPERLEAIRRDNPLAGFNPAWDTRRLWITSFIEEDRHVVIEGLGKTNEDVAEFLRRLSLSDSFGEVALTQTEAVNDTASHLDLISFELSCSVVY
jgi:type IV pilus assembly protein PilN